MVFYGEFPVSFSAPGRIVLPKKIRELLKGTSLIVTKGHGICLAGYDVEDWTQRAHELTNVSLLDNEQIVKRRVLFSSATSIDIDDQGRFVIPKTLLAYAQLTTRAIVVGVGDHFEIWSVELWDQYINKS